MEWSSFLIQVASRSTAAAAGAAAAPAGPVASIAAGSVASVSTEWLLGEFLQAQETQLGRIEALNRDLQGRLVGLEQGMETLLTAPLRRARLHVEEAQRRPDERRAELTLARIALFDAWSLAEENPTRRTVVAQHLSVVFALLDDTDAARSWLVRSYGDAQQTVRVQAAEVQQKIEARLLQATHAPRLEKLAVAAKSTKPLAGDAAFMALGYGIYALAVPRYRRRLSRLRSEQKATRAALAQQRAGERLRAMGGALADEARAVIELQRDADDVRQACLRLGAPDGDVPLQELEVAVSDHDVVEIRVLG